MNFGDYLYDFTANGITVFCHQWAADGEAHDNQSRARLIYASIAGPHQAIKAIRAFLPRYGNRSHVSLKPRTRPADAIACINSPAHLLSDNVHSTARIDQLAYTHEVLIVRDPAPDQNGDFQLVAHDDRDLPLMYVQRLTEHTKVTALPEWAPTLWRIAKENSWVKPVASYNVHAWLCETRERQMIRTISELLQQNLLPIP